MGNAAAHWARETGGLATAVTRWEELLESLNSKSQREKV
jgi:cytochrome c-type biogenesis protein CcmH/NrfG